MKYCLFILALTIGFATGAHAEQLTENVRYEVPVKNSRLKKFSKFELSGIETNQVEDQLEVRYVLPLELTGELNEVVFSGSVSEGETNFTLNGPNGTMMCSSGLEKTCHVQFKDLKIDEDARLKVLQDVSTTRGEFRNRLAVAREFSGDPGGILFYGKPY